MSYWKEFVPESFSSIKKYSLGFFKGDLLAGITVGIITIPIAMAFAIASGVGPEKGLFTAIIAGFLISFLGGSRYQIGGPTGAFVVIIYEIIQRLDYQGLAAATLLAAFFLLLAAFFRLGNLIKYIPYPLITGFTTAIAVSIFSSQVKDFLGLNIAKMPPGFIEKWHAILTALPSFDTTTFATAFGTLLLIILVKKFVPFIPWGIAAVVLSTLVVWAFDLPVETIASRFGEIPRHLPHPTFPHFSFQLADIRELIPDAITIAFLAAIESLLSAIVADGMTNGRHKSNVELMGQGFANLGSIFFGGIPATGAIARTATNIKTGAKTPLAGMLAALTVFLIILAFAPLVSQIPLAALSAVLMMIAWNMSELHHFRHLFKAPLSDVAVMLVTFFLTILVDLTVAVEVGMILAVILFMKRMVSVSKIAPLTPLEEWISEGKEPKPLDIKKLPPHVEVYSITGPFFFGVADSLKSLLNNLEYPPKVFILRLSKVPLIDATGMHALREFHYQCKKSHTQLFLSEVKPSCLKTLKKFGIVKQLGSDHIFTTLHSALDKANKIIIK